MLVTILRPTLQRGPKRLLCQHFPDQTPILGLDPEVYTLKRGSMNTEVSRMSTNIPSGTVRLEMYRCLGTSRNFTYSWRETWCSPQPWPLPGAFFTSQREMMDMLHCPAEIVGFCFCFKLKTKNKKKDLFLNTWNQGHILTISSGALNWYVA